MVGYIGICKACGYGTYKEQCTNRRCTLYNIGKMHRTQAVRRGLAASQQQGFNPIDLANAMRMQNHRKRQDEQQQQQKIPPEMLKKIAALRAARLRYQRKIDAVSAGGQGMIGVRR